jgi:membrane protease YdiL (CAAX protease family)
MSLPFSFLVGLLIYLKIRNRKKRVKAETWTLSDGFLSIFMFLVFSLLASIWIFIPLSIIPGQIKIIFLQITAGVMTVLLFLFLVVKRKWSIKERFLIKKVPVRKLITWVLCSVLFIFLFDYCYDFVFSLLKIKKEQQFIVTIIPDKSMGILTKLFFISAVGFVIPLLEEIIFRGIFYQGLKSRLPVTVAILLSSSVFALFHLQPEALIPIFVLSMIITYSYEKTESILTPIAIHSLNNFIGIVIIIFFK